MARMRHPCVVNFLGVCTMPAPPIITEFAGSGSLYNVLTKARKRPALAAQLTLAPAPADGAAACPEGALRAP